jgi:hypothetical protein
MNMRIYVVQAAERNTLCPRRECCIVVCVALFKAELNLVSPIVCLVFYSSRSGSYTMIEGPIGGPRVVGSLYSRVLPARSSK